MNELRVNFYDEIIQTTSPKTFRDFQNSIAREFCLDHSDVDELIFYYQSTKSGKVRIINEGGYHSALACGDIKHQAIPTIYIEVCETSRLYMQELQNSEIFLHTIVNTRQLQQDTDNNSPINFATDNQLRDTINKTLISSVSTKFNQITDDLISRTLSQAVQSIKKLPVKASSKCTLTADPKIHEGFYCDGCGVYPIVGIRYHCTECYNFDFCEKCEHVKGEEHQHLMIKYRQPSNNTTRVQKILFKVIEYYQTLKRNVFCENENESKFSIQINDEDNYYLPY